MAYWILSQWILIYKSDDYFDVKKKCDELNDEYNEYYVKCLENNERPADNECFLVELDEENEK